MLNAFTVDVEDYFHVSAFADRIDTSQWDHFESRVVSNTHRVLRLLDRYSVHGTFFVLGWVADRFPQLVRDIQCSGHEIGCHSYWHRLIYDLTPDEFRADLRRSTDIIEDITGKPCIAYRAPSFSITKRSLWALEILIEEGYQYDSSIFPIRHDRYGIPDSSRWPFCVTTNAGQLWEFPPSVHRIGRINIPISGGGYFRLYPGWLSNYWLDNVSRKHAQPCMFYIHPWELDPDQPRLECSRRSRFRHYQNLHTTEAKLHRLLRSFQFAPMTEVLEQLGSEVAESELEMNSQPL